MKRFTLAVVFGVIIVASLAIWAAFNQVLANFPVAVLLFGLVYAFVIIIAGGRRSLQPASR